MNIKRISVTLLSFTRCTRSVHVKL